MEHQFPSFVLLIQRRRSRWIKGRVNPYIGTDGDTPCIGHVCPYDTSCNLNLGIDQIKQNTFVWSGEVFLKKHTYTTFYDYFATWKKIKRAEYGDSFPHTESFFGTISIYMTRYNQTL